MPQAKQTSLPPARSAALEALAESLPRRRARQLDPGGRDVQASLDAVLRRANLEARDQALCTELVYGCLRLLGRTDYVLSLFLKKPGDLPEPAALALRLAAHEILNLDRVPARASVNWAAGHLGRLYGKRLAGLANAVLRRVAEAAPEAAGQAFYGRDARDPTALWSRFYSCPAWIVDLWRAAYGEERCRALLEAQINAPPTGLRVNLARDGGQDLFDALANRPDCLFARAPMLAFERTPRDFDLEAAVERGELSRQSAAAGDMLSRLAPKSWPTPVFDACCGRGGKTLHLAEAGVRPLFAADVHRGRLRALSRECGRLGLTSAPVLAARAEKPPLGRPMGTILLDAPCSGLGVLARRPDAKWRRTPEDCRTLAALQNTMLQAAFAALRPGGLLAYVTCTRNPAENQDQITTFARQTPGARVREILEPDPLNETQKRLGEFFFAGIIEKS